MNSVWKTTLAVYAMMLVLIVIPLLTILFLFTAAGDHEVEYAGPLDTPRTHSVVLQLTI
ncbi:hypothetical protein DE4587_00760 [Mycobacteroides salmoniphilum]|nr:hypothetical protein DE4586_00844 [Mycobacteroides salmoniphilum]TDZ88401.1 hypothetical protein DE4587_00760 [Mycobacteroides salmoniphilum]